MHPSVTSNLTMKHCVQQQQIALVNMGTSQAVNIRQFPLVFWYPLILEAQVFQDVCPRAEERLGEVCGQSGVRADNLVDASVTLPQKMVIFMIKRYPLDQSIPKTFN